MSVYDETSHGPGKRGRANAGRTAGATMPQAVIISTIVSAVLVLAVVLRLHGIPMTETLQILGGAGGIGAGLVLAVTPGGRGRLAAVARAAVHSGR
ncbi:hypothetical protein AB0F11_14250 [Streptomyces sp. NPDC032472]|uniref:hypothetical protein n=1 Tax=Streptomyces sp. NPDC032472 TaxID=3155018 RepID=UPI0033E40E33